MYISNALRAAVSLATVSGLALPVYAQSPVSAQQTIVAREAGSETTVRAVRLNTALRIDGNLDEELYTTTSPIHTFIQQEPARGEPASERTELWLAFDGDNLYVAVRAFESQPDRMIVNEMRRDSVSIQQNENVQFAFDTFRDRRNAVSFTINPIGGRMDGQVTNENVYNGDWNPIWRLEVRRSNQGWTAEAAIPFKSLRYRPGQSQVWGFQARRSSRWKNEISYLTTLPAAVGNAGHLRVSEYATMVGLDVPSGGTRALDLKPYVTANLTTDRTSSPPRENEVGRDVGFDAKYSVTQNLTADFTYRTDFAQVEADEQQLNLTRFNIAFPEKRDFFLENQGLFLFGANNTTNTTRDASTPPMTSETPVPFYSRRIGLENRRQVPIEVGARLSGRVGRYTLGLLNIQSGEPDDAPGSSPAVALIPSNNFSVARIRRDVLRRSAVGMLYTRRAEAVGGGGAAETYGADGSFAFYQNLYVVGYWARTKTPGTGDDDTSYRGQVFYNADRWGLQAERLAVGEDFDPQVGFMRREDFHKTRALVRFSPRPRNHFTAVRRFSYQAHVEYFTDAAGGFESRERRFEFIADFQSSDLLEVTLEDQRERIARPFEISGITIPVGDYKYRTADVSFRVGQQRRVPGTWTVSLSDMYDGTRQGVSYSGRLQASQRLALEPSISVNRLDVPSGEGTTKLVGSRVTYTVTPLMFVSSLVQYNSDANSLSTNVRWRWEYQPGSELFVVYNDGRDTGGSRSATLQNRALIFKINRLFRF